MSLHYYKFVVFVKKNNNSVAQTMTKIMGLENKTSEKENP